MKNKRSQRSASSKLYVGPRTEKLLIKACKDRSYRRSLLKTIKENFIVSDSQIRRASDDYEITFLINRISEA